MEVKFKNRQVEVTKIERNRDGSKFIVKANYIDGNMEDLTDDELDKLQDLYDDHEDLNAYWQG